MPSAWPLLAPIALFAAVTAVALAFRAALLRRARVWAAATGAAGPVLRGVRAPSALWCVVLGLAAAAGVVDRPARYAATLRALLEALVILSLTVTLAGVLAAFVAAAGERRGLGLGVTGFAQTAVRLGVYLVGGLVLVSSLGVQVAPLVTALGIGGLAVALALQDTLGNLFAVLHLLTDRPIRIGDWVRIGETEGRVEDIGWRSTRIRAGTGVLVVVPNKRVVESVVLNYDLPEPRMAVAIVVRVAHDADPERVEAALGDEARRAVGALDGLLDEPAPSVRLAGIDDFALEFSVGVWVREFRVQSAVEHGLRKRIVRRLRGEGIALAHREPRP
jgi:small-conductance mechanosensitive channel